MASKRRLQGPLPFKGPVADPPNPKSHHGRRWIEILDGRWREVNVNGKQTEVGEWKNGSP